MLVPSFLSVCWSLSAWGGVQMWWLVPGARALGRDGGSGVPWTCDGVAVARGYPGVCEEGGWRWLAPRPGASAGGVLPSVNTCTGREFGSRPFPHAPLKQWRLASKAAGTSSTHTLSCGCSPIPASLGSFCMAILSPLPGLMSEAWVPAPSPILHLWVRVSGWGVQGGDTDCLCSFPSALAAAVLFWGSEAPLRPGQPPCRRGGFPEQGTFPLS